MSQLLHPRRRGLTMLELAIVLAVLWGLSRGDWLHGLLAGLTLAMAILP